MTKEHSVPGDPNIVSMIELDLWLASFEVQGRMVEDQYIIENITPRTDESLGAKVAKVVMSEWDSSYDGASFKKILSTTRSALLYMYGTMPLYAFVRAEQFIKEGRDNPPAPLLVKDEIDEIIDELLAPETEEEALHEELEEFFEGKRDEALLLAIKDPRAFIDSYADKQVKRFTTKPIVGDEAEIFDIKTMQRAFKFTKGRFRLLYDRAEELGKKE